MIRNAQQLQGFFQCAALVVAAKQNANLTPRWRRVWCGVFLCDELDFRSHFVGLVRGVTALPYADAFAIGGIAPQRFRVLVRVVGNQCIGGAQHAVGAAVVLFQLDDFERRVIRAQRKQIIRIGPAPGVNALVVVAHAGELACVTGNGFEQAILRIVGVLAFVHQQIADALAPGHADLVIGFQQLHRQPNQIIKIHRIECR